MKFDDFFQRVAKTTGITTQKELAGLLGIEPAAITLAKSRGVPKSWGLTIAAAFGVNLVWLKTGSGPVYQNEQVNTLLVPKVAARACAGGGSFELSDMIVDELPFDRSWLSKKGNPGRMVAMEVIGDSMSPELEPGDNILIDQSQDQVADNSIDINHRQLRFLRSCKIKKFHDDIIQPCGLIHNNAGQLLIPWSHLFNSLFQKFSRTSDNTQGTFDLMGHSGHHSSQMSKPF